MNFLVGSWAIFLSTALVVLCQNEVKQGDTLNQALPFKNEMLENQPDNLNKIDEEPQFGEEDENTLQNSLGLQVEKKGAGSYKVVVTREGLDGSNSQSKTVIDVSGPSVVDNVHLETENSEKEPDMNLDIVGLGGVDTLKVTDAVEDGNTGVYHVNRTVLMDKDEVDIEKKNKGLHVVKLNEGKSFKVRVMDSGRQNQNEESAGLDEPEGEEDAEIMAQASTDDQLSNVTAYLFIPPDGFVPPTESSLLEEMLPEVEEMIKEDDDSPPEEEEMLPEDEEMSPEDEEMLPEDEGMQEETMEDSLNGNVHLWVHKNHDTMEEMDDVFLPEDEEDVEVGEDDEFDIKFRLDPVIIENLKAIWSQPRWQEWSRWSSCSQSCGEQGHMTRERKCVQQDPELSCLGENMHTKACDIISPCQENAMWMQWGTWSACSVSCGLGTRGRSRQCLVEREDFSSSCPGNKTETELCELRGCIETYEEPEVAASTHVGAFWKSWASWSTCSATCGVGSEMRTRKCIEAELRLADADECSGEGTQNRKCVGSPCEAGNSEPTVLVTEGHVSKLRCTYQTGTPILDIYWVTPQGHKIDRQVAAQDKRYSLEGPFLYVLHAVGTDAGTYHCIIVRPENKTQTADATLAVVTCSTHPCQNGGTCIEMRDAPGNPLFICDCPSGYKGRFCQKHSSATLYVSLAVMTGVVAFITGTIACAVGTKEIRKEKGITFNAFGGKKLKKLNFPDESKPSDDHDVDLPPEGTAVWPPEGMSDWPEEHHGFDNLAPHDFQMDLNSFSHLAHRDTSVRDHYGGMEQATRHSGPVYQNVEVDMTRPLIEEMSEDYVLPQVSRNYPTHQAARYQHHPAANMAPHSQWRKRSLQSSGHSPIYESIASLKKVSFSDADSPSGDQGKQDVSPYEAMAGNVPLTSKPFPMMPDVAVLEQDSEIVQGTGVENGGDYLKKVIQDYDNTQLYEGNNPKTPPHKQDSPGTAPHVGSVDSMILRERLIKASPPRTLGPDNLSDHGLYELRGELRYRGLYPEKDGQPVRSAQEVDSLGYLNSDSNMPTEYLVKDKQQQQQQERVPRLKLFDHDESDVIGGNSAPLETVGGFVSVSTDDQENVTNINNNNAGEIVPVLPAKKSSDSNTGKNVPVLPSENSSNSNTGVIVPVLSAENSSNSNTGEIVPVLSAENSSNSNTGEIVPVLSAENSSNSNTGEIVPVLSAENSSNSNTGEIVPVLSAENSSDSNTGEIVPVLSAENSSDSNTGEIVPVLSAENSSNSNTGEIVPVRSAEKLK